MDINYIKDVQSGMSKQVSDIALKLKEIRRRSGLSIAQVSKAMGFHTASGYQHYEDRYKKDFLPADKIESFKTVFCPYGIEPGEIESLARPTKSVFTEPHRSTYNMPSLGDKKMAKYIAGLAFEATNYANELIKDGQLSLEQAKRIVEEVTNRVVQNNDKRMTKGALIHIIEQEK